MLRSTRLSMSVTAPAMRPFATTTTSRIGHGVASRSLALSARSYASSRCSSRSTSAALLRGGLPSFLPASRRSAGKLPGTALSASVRYASSGTGSTAAAATGQPVVQSRRSLIARITLSGYNPWIKWPVRALLSIVFSGVTVIGGLLAWDATTYKTKHVEGVPVNPLALNPTRGGPKNLKIAQFLVGDEESDVGVMSFARAQSALRSVPVCSHVCPLVRCHTGDQGNGGQAEACHRWRRLGRECSTLVRLERVVSTC